MFSQLQKDYLQEILCQLHRSGRTNGNKQQLLFLCFSYTSYSACPGGSTWNMHCKDLPRQQNSETRLGPEGKEDAKDQMVSAKMN